MATSMYRGSYSSPKPTRPTFSAAKIRVPDPQAASGLGRAFFYAGTRALLVTNWSVHSQSAKELVTDLFKRQADDTSLTRGEALRLAMMALADGPGYVDGSGKAEFTYAHPLFWAPYTIIGDGGRR